VVELHRHCGGFTEGAGIIFRVLAQLLLQDTGPIEAGIKTAVRIIPDDTHVHRVEESAEFTDRRADGHNFAVLAHPDGHTGVHGGHRHIFRAHDPRSHPDVSQDEPGTAAAKTGIHGAVGIETYHGHILVLRGHPYHFAVTLQRDGRQIDARVCRSSASEGEVRSSVGEEPGDGGSSVADDDLPVGPNPDRREGAGDQTVGAKRQVRGSGKQGPGACQRNIERIFVSIVTRDVHRGVVSTCDHRLKIHDERGAAVAGDRRGRCGTD